MNFRFLLEAEEDLVAAPLIEQPVEVVVGERERLDAFRRDDELVGSVHDLLMLIEGDRVDRLGGRMIKELLVWDPNLERTYCRSFADFQFHHTDTTKVIARKETTGRR